MTNVDLESIRFAANNIRVCMKYERCVQNDSNLNSALQALTAVIARNKEEAGHDSKTA